MGLIWVGLGTYAAAALVVWLVVHLAARQPKPKPPAAVRIWCAGCGWAGTVDGPAHLVEGGARWLTESHAERTGHAANWERNETK